MKSVFVLLLVLVLGVISRADMNGMKTKRAYALGYGHAPVYAAHAPVVHHTAVAAAPLAYHAPVAKYAATSYVSSAINHAPIIAAAHAPIVTHAAPVVAHAAPLISHTSLYHHDPYLTGLHNPLPYYYHRR